MRQLKWVFISLLVFFIGLYVLGAGCTPRVLGKTGFDVQLSVTGMKRVTSVFRVTRSLKKADAMVIDDAVYKVTQLRAPLNGWHLDPDEPQDFTLEVWALAGKEPADGVNAATAARVKTALIEVVERLGFEANVERIEPREVGFKFVFN